MTFSTARFRLTGGEGEVVGVVEFLEGFDRIRATRSGGTFVRDDIRKVPWKLVLHTTEGSTISGAVAAYTDHGGWPHFTVSFAERRKVQHYPLSVSSRAVKNLKRGVETNRARAISVEITGFAARAPEMSAEELEWVGAEVVRPMMALFEIPAVTPPFVAFPASFGFKAKQRFNGTTWLAFSGVCGHQHVAENDHGDPGAINVQAILGAGVPAILDARVQPLQEDDDMTPTEHQLLVDLHQALAEHVKPTSATVQALTRQIEKIDARLAALEAKVGAGPP